MRTAPFYFGSRSLLNLGTCCWDLQCIAQEAIKEIDFTVICGFRDKKNQTMAFNCGASRLEWDKSYHNQFPSEAFDFLSFPFTSWDDTDRFIEVANTIKIAAARLNIGIECGADWTMKDYGHVQII